MATIIYVTGAKGGAGATTLCAGLGLALARLGERTLIVDGDSECGDGLLVNGMQGLNVYSLADAKSGACRIKQATVQHPENENLYILPTLGCADGEYAAKAVKSLDGLFDYILCDRAAVGACSRAIVVTEPYPSSVKGADDKLSKLTDGGMKRTEIIVNKLNGGLVFEGAVMTPQETASLLRAELCGVIPEDLGLPLGRMKAATQKAISLCAAKIAGKSNKIYSVIKAYGGLGGAIKRRMRRAL